MDLTRILSGEKIINLFHVFGVALMFIIIGILNIKDLHTHGTGYFLIIMAIVIILYHSYLYMKKYMDGL